MNRIWTAVARMFPLSMHAALGLMLVAMMAAAESPPSFRWVRQAGGTAAAHEQGTALVLDEAGNCYQAGCINAGATFANGTILPNHGMFLAKYDRTGILVWVTGDGSTLSWYRILPMGIGLDAAHNIFVLCEFSDRTVTFGSQILTNPGPRSIILATTIPDQNGFRPVFETRACGSSIRSRNRNDGVRE